MRLLPMLLLIALAPGCERLTGHGSNAIRSRAVQGEWRNMSLPFRGGKVTRTDPDAIIVQYPDRGQTDRQGIAKRYDASLRSNGWNHRQSHGDLVTQKVRRHSYTTPDGGKAMLTVDDRGDVIRVTIRHM